MPSILVIFLSLVGFSLNLFLGEKFYWKTRKINLQLINIGKYCSVSADQLTAFYYPFLNSSD